MAFERMVKKPIGSTSEKWGSLLGQSDLCLLVIIMCVGICNNDWEGTVLEMGRLSFLLLGLLLQLKPTTKTCSLAQ